MAKFTDEARRRLATGWDPRVSTLREYARQNGVSERALRGWRERLRHESGKEVPAGNAAVPPYAAVDGLHARLEALEATATDLQANIAAVRAILDAALARYAVPPGTSATEGAKPEPVVIERKPMPAPGFIWL